MHGKPGSKAFKRTIHFGDLDEDGKVMSLSVTGSKNVDWIELVQDMDLSKQI